MVIVLLSPANRQARHAQAAFAGSKGESLPWLPSGAKYSGCEYFFEYFDTRARYGYIGVVEIVEGDSGLNRDIALLAARERFEGPIWALIGELEGTLADFARVRHVELGDPRATGSVLNGALPGAAAAVNLSDHGLVINYCENGQSNKITGALGIEGKEFTVSFELHLAGPRGGTSKAAHQFAAYDIESEPTLPGFEVEAPSDLLFFIACHLSGTGASVSRAYLKFADKIDQRKIEIHRELPSEAAGMMEPAPVDGPLGTKVSLKKGRGDEFKHGSETDKRGDAASSS